MAHLVGRERGRDKTHHITLPVWEGSLQILVIGPHGPQSVVSYHHQTVVPQCRSRGATARHFSLGSKAMDFVVCLHRSQTPIYSNHYLYATLSVPCSVLAPVFPVFLSIPYT